VCELAAIDIRANLPETSQVTIDIAPLPTSCELTLVHTIDPKWADFAGRVEQTWTTMLGALARVVESCKDASKRAFDDPASFSIEFAIR
jgi:hypothetical protein